MRVPARAQAAIAASIVGVAIVAAFAVGDADRITLTNVLVVVAFAFSWNLVGGILGELTFAHAIFFGAGVYAVTLGVIHHWSPWLVLLGAPAVTVVGGGVVVLAGAAARLDGLSWFVATLVLTLITAGVVAQIHALGGSGGLIMPLLPWSPAQLVATAIALVVVAAGINLAVTRSWMGRRWVAVRDDPVAAQSHGISEVRERLLAYAISAPLACVAGMVSGLVTGFASPAGSLGVGPIVLVVLSVYIGGPGTVWGPLLGVALLQGVGIFVERMWDDPDLAEYSLVIQYAIAFVIVMVAFTRRSHPGARTDRLAVELDRLAIGERPVTAAAPIRLDGVSKAYGPVSVLPALDLSLPPGSVIGLVGSNGAGKTTLLNVVAGLVPPTTGRVWLGDTDVTSAGVVARSRHLRRSFQTPRVFAGLSVADNVRVPAPLARPAAVELLHVLGVGDVAKRASIATTGERRMIELAWAAAGSQPWLLFDEPLAGLDDDEISAVLGLIRRAADEGLGVVVVEHRLAEIVPYLDRMIVLDLGVVIADGSPSSVLADPRVIAAYLGDLESLPGCGPAAERSVTP